MSRESKRRYGAKYLTLALATNGSSSSIWLHLSAFGSTPRRSRRTLSFIAMKVDRVLTEALALPEGDRAKLVAKLLASLSPSKPSASAGRLLELAGRGAGIWGDDSAATLDRQRNEWR